MRTCTIDGCTRPLLARGWCSNHYSLWYRSVHGRPARPKVRGITGELTPQQIIGLWNRLWRNTMVDENGCWVWIRQINASGYGQTTFLNQTCRTHRVAMLVFGPTFDHDLTIDHLCRNRACWNLAHLEPCSFRDNVLRGVGPTAINAAKTHCPLGHPLSGENLVQSAQTRVRARVCLTCDRNRNRQSMREIRQRRARDVA